MNPAVAHPNAGSDLTQIVTAYLREAPTPAARANLARATDRFINRFGSLPGWVACPVAERVAADVEVRTFAAFAATVSHIRVDPEYVVDSLTKWATHVKAREPLAAATFNSEAASLGFTTAETGRMWAKLAQICVINGQSPDTLASSQYVAGREALVNVATAKHQRAPKALTIPLFGLDAIMFHRGQAPQPKLRQQDRPAHETSWSQVAKAAPQLAATMQRYLDQLRISLRASSVTLIDTTLNQLAGLLITDHPDVSCVAQIGREHIEAYKLWLAARPGYRGQATISKTTIGMRIGHLHAFFERITEWGYEDIPARIPVYNSDRPLKNTPLPRFLDDPTAKKFMTAARALPDQFDRLVIELLARTGMRKGEVLGLTIDAVVQIGSQLWLRTPIGKLHNDRYIPLHPALKDLLDQWLAVRPNWQASNLLLTDRGRPIPGQRVDRAVRRAASAAGVGHVHPHQLRHTLATQAINNGMSLEAIAALLGHKTMKMTMVYARISDRTVATEYFKVTKKVEALYHEPSQAALPAEAEGPAMKQLRTETHRLLGNGYCTRSKKLECKFEAICEGCTFFQTSIEFRPTLQRQRDDAAHKGQLARQETFEKVLAKLDQTGT